MDTFSLILSILAVLVAAVSVLFARQQVQVAQSSFRVQSILALVDHLQRPDIRDCRRTVLTDMVGIPVSDWSDEQRAAASGVAASYDIVGTLLRAGAVDGNLILKSYAPSIIRCHEVCAPMIEGFRRSMPAALAKRYWADFDWLAHEARTMIGHVGPVWPRASNNPS